MLDELVPIVAIVCVFAFPIFLLWVILETKKVNLRNKERMSLISQGIIPDVEIKRQSKPNRFVSLRNGIIFIGIAVGILVGFILSEGMALEDEKAFWIYSSSILLFLGVGYLVYFFTTRNMEKASDPNDLSEE